MIFSSDIIRPAILKTLSHWMDIAGMASYSTANCEKYVLRFSNQSTGCLSVLQHNVKSHYKFNLV